jgi:hypothetical protein
MTNKKSYQEGILETRIEQEILRNFIQFSYGGEDKVLLSGKGVHHIEQRVIDDEVYETGDTRGAANTYGIQTVENCTGGFTAFYVTYDGCMWQRETLIDVGQLLDALIKDHETKKLKAA